MNKTKHQDLEIECQQVIDAVDRAELQEHPRVNQLLEQLQRNPRKRTLQAIRQMIRLEQIRKIRNPLPEATTEFDTGNIHLGKDLFSSRHIFGDFQSVFGAHAVVVARSGFGKSTLLTHLLSQVSEIEQPKGFLAVELGKIGLRSLKRICPQFNVARPEDIHINPCEIENGVNPKDALQPQADAISDALDATMPGRRWTTQCLDNAFTDNGIYEGSHNYPTLGELRSYILKGKDRKVVDGILNRLDPCLQSTNMFATKRGWSTKQLLSETCSLLELESQNETSQKLAVGSIIAKEFVRRKYSRAPNLSCDFLCLLDDTQHLCGHENSFIVKHINVIRSTGMAFLLSFQGMQNVHPSILANAGTILCGHLRDPHDRDMTLRSMGIMSLSEQRAIVRKQHQKGVFLLSLAERGHPVFIRVPNRNLSFPETHDPGILRSFAVEKKQDEINWKPPEWKCTNATKQSTGLTQEEIRYLRAAEKNGVQTLGVTELEQTFGLTKRVREHLLEQGMLDSQLLKVSGSGRNRTVLTLSQKGNAALKEASS